MSQENVDLVQRMYEAFNREDWDAALACTSPEIEWETDPRHPDAGIHRGREAFRGFLEDLEDPFAETLIEVERFFDRDDQVVAYVTMRRRPKDSTAEVAITIGELWTVRGGEIVRGQAFGEREKALEAAGLS